MEALLEVLGYAFMQRALLAGLAVAAMGGMLGTLLVQRRLSFLGDGLAHAAFGGMGVGAFVVVSTGAVAAGSGILRDPLWIAVPCVLLVSLAVAFVRQRTGISGDTAIGVFFAVSVALGILFFSRIPPDAPVGVNVFDLLFGSVLAVRQAELTAILLTAVAVLALLALNWGRLAYASFDDELARSDGVATARLEYLLFAISGLTVAVSAVVVGVVLMAAYLIIPAAAARMWSRTMAGTSLRAVLIGMATTVAGMLASFVLDLPSGSAIILAQATVFALAALTRRG